MFVQDHLALRERWPNIMSPMTFILIGNSVYPNEMASAGAVS